MTAENLTLINEKLNAAGRDSSAKLGKLDDRLQLSKEKTAAAVRSIVLSSADNHNLLAPEFCI
jgi:hypothetical protein